MYCVPNLVPPVFASLNLLIDPEYELKSGWLELAAQVRQERVGLLHVLASVRDEDPDHDLVPREVGQHGTGADVTGLNAFGRFFGELRDQGNCGIGPLEPAEPVGRGVAFPRVGNELDLDGLFVGDLVEPRAEIGECFQRVGRVRAGEERCEAIPEADTLGGREVEDLFEPSAVRRAELGEHRPDDRAEEVAEEFPRVAAGHGMPPTGKSAIWAMCQRL